MIALVNPWLHDPRVILLPSLTVTQVKLFLAIHKAVCPCRCLAKQVSVEIK